MSEQSGAPMPSSSGEIKQGVQSGFSGKPKFSIVDAGDGRNIHGEQYGTDFQAQIRRLSKPDEGLVYRVPSETNPVAHPDGYIVHQDVDGRWICGCADFDTRKKSCKHIVGVVYLFHPEIAPTISPTIRAVFANAGPYQGARRFPHIPEIYASGLAESTRLDRMLQERPERVRELLADLKKTLDVDAKPAKRGGQPTSPGDVVFLLVYREFLRQSVRANYDTRRLLKREGHVDEIRCKSTLLKYGGSSETTELLLKAYRAVIWALTPVESIFIVDGTGFSPMYVSNFFDKKYRGVKPRPGTEWLNLHVVMGQRSKAILGFTLTPHYGAGNGELSQFEALIDWIVANRFESRQFVVADNLYLTEGCLKMAADRRMQLISPTKPKNFDPKTGELKAFLRAVDTFRKEHPDSYDWLARARSAIEGSFSVLKREDNHIAAVGTQAERLDRSLGGVYTARLNEMLCRAIAQALTRIHAMEVLAHTDERVSFFDRRALSSSCARSLAWNLDRTSGLGDLQRGA